MTVGELHGRLLLPNTKPMRREVIAPMRIIVPIQSICAIATLQLSGLLYRKRINIAIVKKAAAEIGRFRRKIQRHNLSAITPPSGGPTIAPRAATESRIPRYLLRSRILSMSHSIISISSIIPPPPTPCSVRPTIKVSPLLAKPHTAPPMKKKTTDVSIGFFRPIMSEI